MKYQIGKSTKRESYDAVKEATANMQNPKLVLFFSGVEEFESYSKEVKRVFPDSIVMGSTTFVGLCKEGAFKETLLVLGMEEGIECYGNVMEEVDRYPIKYVKRIEECVNQFSDTTNSVCVEFSSALISSEELILSTLTSVLDKRNIPVFGGSAGDRGMAERSMISFDGVVYDKACVFVIIKNLGGKIHLYRENIYKPTQHVFTATKVDVRNRIVYEYDYRPAAEMIAKGLGTTIDSLPNYLDSYPMGRKIGNEMYIVANKSVEEKKAMAYHARVYKNSKMVLLEPDNYKEVIKETREQIKREVKRPSFCLMVHCLARSILFETDGYLNAFAKEMGDSIGNYVGFAGYGEQLNQQHFNQTMVIAVFE